MALFSSLAQPVGALMRPCPTLAPSDSLARAAELLRESSAGLVPVVHEGVLLGVVTEHGLGQGLEHGLDALHPVEEVIEPAPEALPIFATGAEALRRLRESRLAELPVVDRSGRLAGVVSASDLYPRPEATPNLPTIGGMATPFGVYLTAGGVRGGAGQLALVGTGMMLAAIFLTTTFVSDWLVETMTGFTNLLAAPEWAYSLVQFFLFLLSIRLIPLSGTHAAEHMTVHAMEWGEPLEMEVVRRMPRVHPRCGTNLAVGLSLFMALAGWKWTDSEQIRLLTAMVVSLFAWRPLGNLVQQYITTKTPNDAQIQSGIRAGKELIANFHEHGQGRISFLQRLLSSGIFHVMAGSTLTFFLSEAVARLFGQTLGL